MRSGNILIRCAVLLALVPCLATGAFGGQAKAKAKAKQAGSLLEVPEVSRDQVICFALYTVHNNILKLTAQLYPLVETDPRTVRLEIKEGGTWKQVAEAKVIEQGWTATFRVENWDSSRDIAYRVAHGKTAFYTGTVLKDPVAKETITVAVFTGNSIYPGHGGDIPKNDIVENIKRIKPDLLFFSGDQVYDHNRHYAYWLKFGRDFGEIIRNIPTITIPDDHDVGHANLWGAGGKKSNTGAGHDGGYFKPVEYVQEVERAQTSHLPDPYDPTPILRGIGVYYTAMTLGRVSFAVIEDRKFKSGPSGLVPKMGPRPDHVRDPNYDPKTVDVPGAELLGERQLKFLGEWAADWHGADMKAVLSQTVFAGAATIHGSKTNRLHADMDSNGWPQTGRCKALHEIRRGFATMLCGDQHLGTVVHHGIDDWNDAGYSLCVPSIANLYLRWWAPLEPGKNRAPGMPEHCGEFLDGFGNKITMVACANPTPEENHDRLTTRAAGFGVARFNCKTRNVTLECWPRNADVTDPKTQQYAGWPVTFDHEDNYGRKAVAYLPTIEVAGMADPVVQVIDEADGQIVYTLRIRGSTYRPKVFKKGTYTVKVGEQGTAKWKTLTGIQALSPDDTKRIKVDL
ncbi:MAG TPA: metallophosphoesterase family protein [Phycisphaerae bacterium]|nr:metallophosphoesterase family protein [Phycisphaerae bacterium]